jgi:HEAT repeat protein
LQAAQVLGGWGMQESALPSLVKLLEHPDTNVRLQAAEVLSRWGMQESAVPSLVNLLEDPDANVRYQAAQLLGGWGRKHPNVAGIILQELSDQPISAIAALFQQADRSANKPIAMVQRITLASLLQPRDIDSPRMAALRSILGEIVWQTFATTA